MQTKLLVLPLSPQYRVGWNYYATVDTRDRMFGDIDAVAIETEIANSGFAVVKPRMPDRRSEPVQPLL